MFKIAKPFFIHTRTSLHAGSGESLGVVDLPIQRERHTSFPKIESSSLKGAIREAFEDRIFRNKENEIDMCKIELPDELCDKFPKLKDENNKMIQENNSEYSKAVSLAFGPESGDAHAGALGFTDARILLFPVKSMKGVFAWITCPLVLKRFLADIGLYLKHEIKTECEQVENGSCMICDTNINSIETKDRKKKVILEEYSFNVVQNTFDQIIKRLTTYLEKLPQLTERLVILSDDDFKDLVNLSTEVITRTKISAETGTVVNGALFTEEYLPPESVLYSLALATPVFNKEKGIFANKDKNEAEEVLDFFIKGIPGVIQIGGNATIGKGIVKIIKEEKGNGNK